ncbi:hypothetical protein B0T20DRAFT_175899 [Sordaria brevicollis]|uniref:Uncharacterized protein n=1 Tax=Sordaria brevicollis TaxID=83679 RepID=A0AAE0UDF3_SORBR|nr:hypothetical protein B0T20DRAFT_175899 [Sordaria brevicollis]
MPKWGPREGPGHREFSAKMELDPRGPRPRPRPCVSFQFIFAPPPILPFKSDRPLPSQLPPPFLPSFRPPAAILSFCLSLLSFWSRRFLSFSCAVRPRYVNRLNLPLEYTTARQKPSAKQLWHVCLILSIWPELSKPNGTPITTDHMSISREQQPASAYCRLVSRVVYFYSPG